MPGVASPGDDRAPRPLKSGSSPLPLPLPLQYRAALLSLMVDVAVMLGAPEKTAQAQMEQALAFETKVAHVKTQIKADLLQNGGFASFTV